eukprot:3867739-Alexandrium_andersonii.AAC.1
MYELLLRGARQSWAARHCCVRSSSRVGRRAINSSPADRAAEREPIGPLGVLGPRPPRARCWAPSSP